MQHGGGWPSDGLEGFAAGSRIAERCPDLLSQLGHGFEAHARRGRAAVVQLRHRGRHQLIEVSGIDANRRLCRHRAGASYSSRQEGGMCRGKPLEIDGRLSGRLPDPDLADDDLTPVGAATETEIGVLAATVSEPGIVQVKGGVLPVGGAGALEADRLAPVV